MDRSAGFLLALLAGCAAQPPAPAELAANEYRRDATEIEARELFEQQQRQCAARGGTVYVPRTSSGRRPPSSEELRFASCTRRHGFMH